MPARRCSTSSSDSTRSSSRASSSRRAATLSAIPRRDSAVSRASRRRLGPAELLVDRRQGGLARGAHLGGLREPRRRKPALGLQPRRLPPRLLRAAGLLADRGLLAVHLAREPVHLVARLRDRRLQP